MRGFQWSLWLWWVAATILGSGTVLIAGSTLFLGTAIEGFFFDILLILFMVLVPIGVVTGLVQWPVLRRSLPRAGWWLLATPVGMILGAGASVTAITLLGGSIATAMLGTLCFGFAFGGAQWLVLRRHFAHSGWWIPATMASMMVGMAVAWVMGKGFTTLEGAIIGLLSGLIITVVLYSFVTGALLVWFVAGTPRLERWLLMTQIGMGIGIMLLMGFAAVMVFPPGWPFYSFKVWVLWMVSGNSPVHVFDDSPRYAHSVTWSPDGTLLAAVGPSDEHVYLWNVSDGSLVRTFAGPLRQSQVAFSPDGQTLAAVGGSLLFWKVSDGSLIRVLDGSMVSVAWSPDGKKVATGSTDMSVRIWQARDGALLNLLQDHTLEVWSVAFSPDGQTLASSSSDTTIKVWQGADGQLVRTLHGHQDSVTSIAFAPNGQTLASGSGDETIKFWHMNDGSLQHTIEGLHSSPLSVAFSPDGHMIAAGLWNSTIKLWRVSDYSLVQTMDMPSYVKGIAFSPDGQKLAAASGNGVVALWRVNH